MNIENFDKQALVEIIQKDYNNIAGIIVQSHGEVVFEQYFHGFNQASSIHIASVTKSIMSILFGIAIDKGFIKNEQQKVLDFFPNYTIKQREKMIHDVCIRHLLTMTAPFKFKSEPYTKVYKNDDWTKATLDLLGGKQLTNQFQYTTVGLQILSGILTNATGMSVLEFTKQFLFKPLGINTPKNCALPDKEAHLNFLKNNVADVWVTDPQGVNTAGWGLTLSTQDLLKIGNLYLNQGKWDEKHIVSSDWVTKSTRVQSQFDDKPYGYLWWLMKDKDAFAGIGDGGNIVYVSHKKNTVIAITSTFKPRTKDRIELIENFILKMLK